MAPVGKNDAANESKQARADEQARQERIRQGTERINSIFDGKAGVGALGANTAYDANKTYYNKDGSVWSPSTAAAAAASFGGSAGGAKPYTGNNGEFTQPKVIGGPGANATAGSLSPAEQFAQALSSGSIYGGTGSSGGGFDDDFYGKRRQAYLDYATPQLEDQFGDASKELTYSLARGGNLSSSVRGQKTGKLQQLFDLNKQQVADQALTYETDTRNSVEDARSNLIQMLNATGDAEGAANSALARSQALSAPAAYSPLSNLFANFTGTLGTQAAQEKAAAASGGSYSPRYNTGLFAGSGRVVNS